MSVKTPAVYNEGYMGKLTVEQCDRIMSIKQKEETPELKNTIFVFPYDLIIESLEREISIRDIVKEKGIDWQQYIGALRPYQTVGCEFLLNTTRSMIGDSVGLGKTAQIAGALNVLKQQGKLKRFIMAVETSAFMQTRVEMIKFTGLNILAVPSEGPKLKKLISKTDWDKVDGIIIKHCTLKSNVFNTWLAMNFDSNKKSKMFNVLIIDESSVIKNNTTQMYQYCENISNAMERTYMMNATPFDKYLFDIYYQFNIMDAGLLPEESFMKSNFCTWRRTGYWKTERTPGVGRGYKRVQNFHWEHEGYKNQDVFKESLKYVYFGRSLRDVGMEVAHTYKIYTVQPTPLQTQLIAGGFHGNEVLNCPTLLGDVTTQGYKELKFDRANNPKLDRLCELAITELQGMSFMVYCYHIEAQYKIKAELEAIGRKVTIINGQDPKGKDKDMVKLERMQKFNSGEYDVIITNMQKSLNLYGADAMILYSNTATVGRLEQIRGRIDRHVDDKVRIFIMLLYEGTSEYELMTKIAKERGQASRDLILDSETAVDYFMASLDGGDE